MKKGKIGTVTAAALIVGGGALAGQAASAMENVGFSFLGSGREVRTSILERQAPASDLIYGANHEAEDKGGEGKCGEGKCGEGKKDKKEEKKEGKDAGEGKCGEGKCGE